MLILRTAESEVRIDPDCGGALTGWTRRGDAILHPVVDPKLVAQNRRAVAGYPLVPFSNRVGQGRFHLDGEAFQLDPNFAGEPHTIHGNGWMRAWSVQASDAASAVLVLDHAPPADPAGQWPFRYHASLTYALRDDGLSVAITIRNTDERTQPVGLGFHPFFPRGADLELGFEAGSVWITGAESLPTARLPVEGGFRFQPMRPVSGPPLDNCFAGWTGTAFLRWPSRGLGLTIRAAAPLGHLVVFTPPGQDHVAVEPASNMTDAVNHPEIPDRGLTSLAPGETLSAEIDFALMGL